MLVDLMGSYRDMGLPRRLGELGMSDAPDGEISESAVSAPHLKSPAVQMNHHSIVAAIRRSEALAVSVAAGSPLHA
jgi:hypothetical protein